MPRFDGVPVSTGTKPRFAGVPVEAAKSQSEASPLSAIANVGGQVLQGAREVPRGMGENIPIVGPLVAGAADAVGSQIASWITGRSPEEERALAHERMAADQETLPGRIGHTTGAVMGMVGPLAQIGMGNAAAGKVLGMSGSLPSRVMMGGLSGFGISASDTLARTGSPQEAGKSALLGGGLGAALPLAGAGFNALRAVAAGKPLSNAESVLGRALSSDQVPVAEIPSRLAALGPDAMIADLGPNLQRQAGALASLPGEPQTVVRNAIAGRGEGTNSRIIDDVNTTLGPAPTPSVLTSGIKANQQGLSPAYEEVFRQNARAVDTSPIALDLDSMTISLRGDAQKRAQQIRSMLNVTGEGDILDPNPETLFQVRQAIDGILATEQNPQAIGTMTYIRRQVDDLLADAVPGLKDVDSQYAELASQSSAIGTGQQLLDSGRTAIRPDELSSMMTAGPQGTLVGPSAVPFRLGQGARAEIERIIGTTTNDLNAMKTALKGDGSWNRDRLIALYGQDKADSLLNILAREKSYASTANVVTQNSETAARQAAQAEVNVGQPGHLQNLTLTGLVASGLQKGANLGAAWRQGGTNTNLARLLIGQEIDPALAASVQRAIEGQGRVSALAPAGGALMGQDWLRQLSNGP